MAALTLTSILQWMSAKFQHKNQRKQEPLLNALSESAAGMSESDACGNICCGFKQCVCMEDMDSGSELLRVTPE